MLLQFPSPSPQLLVKGKWILKIAVQFGVMFIKWVKRVLRDMLRNDYTIIPVVFGKRDCCQTIISTNNERAIIIIPILR